MNCDELVQYLSEYIDHDLNEELEEAARAHLACCHECQVVFDTTRKTILLYKLNDSQVIPVDKRSALYGRLQDALKECLNCPEKAPPVPRS